MHKTIEVDVPITVDDIVEFLSSGSTMKELTDKLSLNTLSYFASRYVNRVNEEDPETYEKFVQYLPTIKPKTKTEPPNKINSKLDNEGTDLIVNIGDTIFIQSRHTSPAYILLIVGHDNFDKWEVADIKKSKTNDYMIMLHSDCKSGISLMHEDLKRLFVKKELYIVKQ